MHFFVRLSSPPHCATAPIPTILLRAAILRQTERALYELRDEMIMKRLIRNGPIILQFVAGHDSDGTDRHLAHISCT